MNISGIFRRYGRTVSAVDNKGNIVSSEKCFVQPLRYKNKMYLEGTPTEIGMNESGYYLFLAPPLFDITSVMDGGYLTDNVNRYHVDRMEKIYLGEKVHFLWAIIRLRYPDAYLSCNTSE